MTKITEERQRLLERLEVQKAQIKEDVDEIKDDVKPSSLLRKFSTDLWGDFRKGNGAVKGLQFAAKLLPAKIRANPAVFIALQFVLPYVLRNYPHLAQRFKGLRLPEVKKSTIIGAVKDRVTSLRHRVQQARMDLEASRVLQSGTSTDQLYV